MSPENQRLEAVYSEKTPLVFQEKLFVNWLRRESWKHGIILKTIICQVLDLQVKSNIPTTQILALVLNGKKALFWGGWPSNIEVVGALGTEKMPEMSCFSM